MIQTSNSSSPTFLTTGQSNATGNLYSDLLNTKDIWIEFQILDKKIPSEIIRKLYDLVTHLWQPQSIDYSKLISSLELEKAITDEYKNIAQVSAITASFSENFNQFTIFTSNHQYDNVLMDRLIDIEIIIKRRFPSLLFSIDYLTFDPNTGKDLSINLNESVLYQA